MEYRYRYCEFCRKALYGKPCKNRDCKGKARKVKYGGSGAGNACLPVLAALELVGDNFLPCFICLGD